MKKTVCLLLAICMAVSLAACGAKPASSAAPQSSEPAPAEPVRQTASAVLDPDGSAIWAELDLTGGWSVEFARGAFYLYGGAADEDELVAIGVTIDRDVYEDYAAAAPENKDYRVFQGGFAYTTEDGYQQYLMTVGGDAFFLFDVVPDADGEAAFDRVTVERVDYGGLFPYEEDIDYLVLVNKLHPLPEGWEDVLETVHMTNSLGDDVEVEAEAYAAYLALKEDLAAQDVFIDLDSAYRSVAEQQRILEEFTETYGADYAAKTVAAPGCSEHHTGLALDLYLNVNGEDVYYNEEMLQYPEIWAKIHEKLPEYGFILRYPEGKEHITGYGYEPWHIRYVGSAEVARYITDSGRTFEGCLGEAEETEVTVDLGSSARFTPEELEEAAVQIKCRFAYWEGCALHSLRYAGDEAGGEEALRWLNELNPEGRYAQAAEFLMDFHSPESGFGAWNLDTEYTDYQWWLGRREDGSWEIVSIGY